MKTRIFSLLLLLVILLSSCSVFEKETFMPTVRVGYAFENDTWLIIEDRLIRKEDGTVLWLEMDKDQKIPGTYATYVEACAERAAYRYVFNEASFEQYTFLTAYGNIYLSTYYYECVVTYGYDGKEIGRTAISGPLTKEEMQAAYRSKASDLCAFAFSVLKTGSGYVRSRLGFIDKKDAAAREQAVLTFAQDLRQTNADGEYYITEGIARHMGEKVWFATNESNRHDDLRILPLINGIRESLITAYDPEAEEFETFFTCENAQVIDFDEKGAYVFDVSKRLTYVDFDTGATTEIYQIPTLIDYITVTDKYIFINYYQNGKTFFVYEKGSGIIANDSSLD